MTVNFCYNHYHFNKLYCHLYRVKLKFLERGKFMKKQKLLICMLSSTLVIPSLPVSHVHAETAKHISETPQSEETSSDESSSLDDKSKSEETPSDETASSNEETQTEKSSSSNKKEENTKSSKTKDTPRATQKEQRDEDSDRTSSYLNDHFSNDYDFINPSPFKSLSLSNMWHMWFSSDHQATESEQPSTETPSSEAPTTDNTKSTDEAQSAPTTQDEPSPEKPATESTPSRDNSHLSESDKAIADELDRISDSTVPSQTSDEQNNTSQEPSSTEETTEPSTTQDATEETSETPETNADTDVSSNETPSTETETSQPSSDEDASASSSDDHVIDAVLDEYSEKSKDTASHYENQKNQITETSKDQSNTQTKNPQLPSKEAYQKREAPKQSFEDDFKDANLRSTATFETLPGFSGSDDSQDFVIAENKSTRDFIKKIAKDAHDIGQKEDIYASVMMAQAILESDSGNSALARAPHYNLFGIKGAYKGQSATFNTLEDNGGQMYQISASFRSYPNQKASLEDYADLMKNGIDGNPDIYKPTWKSEAPSYRSATEHLSTTYATDSHYADKLNSIIKHYDLTRFDKKQMPDLTHDTTTPEEASSDYKPFVETDGTSPYPHGQCTWYVYNRMAQYGLHIGGDLGDARNWDNRAEDDGYDISMTPKAHSAVVFEAGQQGADSVYGHVAFVEKVNRDGSIVISESNVKGLGVISYRTIDAQEAKDLTYIQGKH